MLREAIAGSLPLSLLVLCLSVPYLWKGRTLLPFVAATAALGIFSGIVYGNSWHQGTMFLAWIVALWIAGYSTRLDWPARVALAIAIAVQCGWTAETIRYDWSQPYSGSRMAASRLRELGAGRGPKIFALGHACIAIEPYFPKNIFANYAYHEGAYWDWSTSNRMNGASLRLSSERPDYVLLAIEAELKQPEWPLDLERAGYRRIEHIPGALFLKDHIQEPEAFDIYAHLK